MITSKDALALPNCIFCQILAGQAPAIFVHQDELCAAFMDIHPINPGHVLVVPRVHSAWLADLDSLSAGHIFQVAQRVDKALFKSGIKCEAINLFLADGSAAGQDVFHVHLHVIPRFKGDGHHMRFSTYAMRRIPGAELEANADLVRNKMGGDV